MFKIGRLLMRVAKYGKPVRPNSALIEPIKTAFAETSDSLRNHAHPHYYLVVKSLPLHCLVESDSIFRVKLLWNLISDEIGDESAAFLTSSWNIYARGRKDV